MADKTLPPCPRADCDADREWAAHHWHWKSDGAADHTHRVCTNYCEFDTQECTRCYSAHVPNVSESPTGSPTAGFVPVAERDELRARLDAVLALHYAAYNDLMRVRLCAMCHGKAGVHECGCWADEDCQPVCGHCLGERNASVPYPCPTRRAAEGDE